MDDVCSGGWRQLDFVEPQSRHTGKYKDAWDYNDCQGFWGPVQESRLLLGKIDAEDFRGTPTSVRDAVGIAETRVHFAPYNPYPYPGDPPSPGDCYVTTEYFTSFDTEEFYFYQYYASRPSQAKSQSIHHIGAGRSTFSGGATGHWNVAPQEVPASRNAVCVSCDDVVSLDARFRCLQNERVHANNYREHSDSHVGRNLGYLLEVLEVQGEDLTVEQRTFVRNLVAERTISVANNDSGYYCESEPDFLEMDSRGERCEEAEEIEWRFRFCAQLLAPHVSVDLIADGPSSEFVHCTAMYEDLLDLRDSGTACAVEPYVVEATRILDALYDKVLLDITEQAASLGGPNPGPEQSLKSAALFARALRMVDDYGVALDVISDADDASWKKQELLARFWRTIDDVRELRDPFYALLLTGAAGEGTDRDDFIQQVDFDSISENGDVNAALAQVRQQSSKIDQELLRAVSLDTRGDGTPNLHGDLLLFYLGQVLNPLQTTLRGLSDAHDIGCAFIDCRPQAPVPATYTPVSALWGLVASIDDAADLNARLSTYGNQNGASTISIDGWEAGFHGVPNMTGAIRSALGTHLDAGSSYQLEELLDVDPAGVSSLAKGFVQLLVEAKTRSGTYESVGLFRPSLGASQTTSFEASKRDDIVALVSQVAHDLEAATSSFEARTTQLIHEIMAARTNQAVSVRVRNKITSLADQADQLDRRILSHNLSVSQRPSLHEVVVELRRAADATPATALTTIPDSRYNGVSTIPITAANAAWSPGLPYTDVGLIAAHQAIAVDAGEVLGISATGNYLPNCSLRLSDVLDADGSGAPSAIPDDVSAGPEGYLLSWSGSSWEADSASQTNAFTIAAGVRGEACYNANSLFHIFTVRACAYLSSDVSHRRDSTHSSGTDGRTSASFAVGTRLKNTPFPNMPAGALLAVEMPRGQTHPNYIRDVHVVRSAGILVPSGHDSDVYLVVNDSTQCGTPDTTQELSVTITKLAGASSVVRQILGALAAVGEIFREARGVVIEQGEFLPSQRQQLRGDAYVAAMSGVSSDNGDAIAVSAFPEPLRSAFDHYITHQLLLIEHALRISQLERELQVLDLEMNTLLAEERAIATNQYLGNQLPALSIRALDADYFLRRSNDLGRLIQEFIVPIVETWYPDAKANIKHGIIAPGSSSPGMDALVNIGPATSPLEVAELLYGVAVLAREEIRRADRRDRETAGARGDLIAVTFVKPGFSADTVFKNADSARSAALWEAMLSGSEGVIQLYPEDLYQAGGGTHVLDCSRELPVLRHVAIVLSGQNATDGLGQAPRLRLAGHVGQNQTYVSSAGITEYSLAEAWSPIQIPFSSDRPNGVVAQARAVVWTSGPGSAPYSPPEGVSPFAPMFIDFQHADQVWLSSATEAVVLLEVETIQNSSVLGVATCN